MCTRRVEMHRLQALVRLHRMGTGAREVARMLHMSPNTERTIWTARESNCTWIREADAESTR